MEIRVPCLTETLSHRPALRQYMLQDDLQLLLPRMYVQPDHGIITPRKKVVGAWI